MCRLPFIVEANKYVPALTIIIVYDFFSAAIVPIFAIDGRLML